MVNINNKENIKEVKITNNKKDIKISQYEDESIFLLIEQESIKLVIKFFEKLNKATGSTINLEKTKVLPINTDQTSYMEKHKTSIEILERYQYIEILSVHFSEDLKDRILLNWQNTLTKMENHIQKMMTRQLSLHGKSILINTLSNVFPIPEKIIQKIHTNIFQYLWQNKTREPIASKTLFLPKNKGDLNIKELETHNLAIRIKHLLTLKQTKDQPPWMHIATYWLGKYIYNYKEFYHLKGNNITKINKMPPLYYRDLVHYIKIQNPNIPNLQNKTKIIYKKYTRKRL